MIWKRITVNQYYSGLYTVTRLGSHWNANYRHGSQKSSLGTRETRDLAEQLCEAHANQPVVSYLHPPGHIEQKDFVTDFNFFDRPDVGQLFVPPSDPTPDPGFNPGGGDTGGGGATGDW